MLYLFISFLIFSDLLSKYIAKTQIEWQIDLISWILFLKYIENPWIAFWIWINWITLKIITIALIMVIIWYYYTEEKKKNSLLIDISFAFIISWAIWNAIERIYNWSVIDFIWIKYFAIFNFADMYISIWVFLYILAILLYNKNKNEVWK